MGIEKGEVKRSVKRRKNNTLVAVHVNGKLWGEKSARAVSNVLPQKRRGGVT